MEHFYNNIQGWFTYPMLYSQTVQNASHDAHFVEIGTWLGRSAAFMAVEIINSGKNIKFDCIDTWRGSQEHNLISIAQQEELYIAFIKNIEPVKNNITAYRTYSTEGAKLYADNSLDFVFIDAAHDYDNVLLDINAWYPKVKSGGVIAGHDYHEHDWPGVYKAAHDFFAGRVFYTSEQELVWYYKKE